MNVLYSKGCLTQPGVDGTCQGATREIKLPRFTRIRPAVKLLWPAGRREHPIVMGTIRAIASSSIGAIRAVPMGLTLIGTYFYGGAQNNNAEEYLAGLKIAAASANGTPINLGRFAVSATTVAAPSGAVVPIRWLYDAACGAPLGGVAVNAT